MFRRTRQPSVTEIMSAPELELASLRAALDAVARGGQLTWPTDLHPNDAARLARCVARLAGDNRPSVSAPR